jgi:hypothetical protein
MTPSLVTESSGKSDDRQIFVLRVVRNGAAYHVEFFPIDKLDNALARFNELDREGVRPVGRGPAEQSQRFLAYPL